MVARIAAALAVFCFGCASPKYNYYFDHVKPGTSESQQQANSPGSSSTQVDKGSVSATTELVPANTESVDSSVDVVPTMKAITIEKPIELSPKAQRKIAKLQSKLERSSKDSPAPLYADGDPKKNGWAVAGFVLSLTAWIVLWPLIFLGIIFSAMGLKSQKRGLAIAGLVIGLAGAVVVIIAAGQGKL